MWPEGKHYCSQDITDLSSGVLLSVDYIAVVHLLLLVKTKTSASPSFTPVFSSISVCSVVMCASSRYCLLTFFLGDENISFIYLVTKPVLEESAESASSS